MDQFSHDPGAFAPIDDPSAPRGGARDSLMLSAQLRVPLTAEPIAVRVRNLSSGGLMAEYAGRAAIDEPVSIDVRGVGWVAGRVAWVAEGRMGIAFDREIDPLLARKPVAITTKAPAPARRARSIL